ncbi:MAG: hypothetical protein O3A46_16290 [Candidatus Poribacteria bacterium]|nr:hypothetical protein [Candidatus Poribacteria bacterium]
MSQFEPHHEKWHKRFVKAVERRDRSKEGTPEYAEAEKEAERCYVEMYEQGYFRDSYNPSSVLWQFGLSWWEQIAELLDEEHRLTPDKAKRLLDMLKEHEPRFQANLSDLRKQEREYFQWKYAAFQAFLNEAIRRKESIDCSI